MRETIRAIVINLDRKCLLVQHKEQNPLDLGKWSTVGGRIEGNEDHLTCLMRELSEEFRESIKDKIEIGPKIFASTRADRIDHFYVVWFRGEDVNVLATEEIFNHGWFSREEASELPLFFGFEADLISKALEIKDI